MLRTARVLVNLHLLLLHLQLLLLLQTHQHPPLLLLVPLLRVVRVDHLGGLPGPQLRRAVQLFDTGKEFSQRVLG